ncbi:MAG: ABC transporter ATP-binding protein [Deltaproteobacteria bacterium]|nr:ABC transporter ATP-binding protein [Deltaproteobacteria bacterium]
MLRVHKLHVHYGDIHVLKEVSFGMEEGEIISMIGANGAGKTTTINVLSGLLRATSGEVYFLGERTDHLPPHRIVERGLVQVPEGRQLFPSLTVLENLEMGSYLLTARQQAAQNLEKVFQLFPILRDRKQQLAGCLSGGEQQMLAISRGLMARPKLLMLDEPSLGLAPLIVRNIFQTIREINSSGTPILLVEQNVFYALSFSHRGYVMESGEIMMEGQGEELLKNEHVKTAYLGV